MFRLFFAIRRAYQATRTRAIRSTQRSSRARALAQRTAASSFAEELLEEAVSLLEEAEAILLDAFLEAIYTMLTMVGNPGQQTVMEDTVIPEFEKTFATSKPAEGWPGVDIGEYMAFMGEIVEEGNAIMESAYDDAAGLIDEADDALSAISG